MTAITQTTVTKLAVLVFVLVAISFSIRGFGQLIVGPRTAMMVAGPVALVAVAVLIFVVAVWLFDRLGVLSIERDGGE